MRYGHEVAGEHSGIGVRWQVAFVDGPPEAVAEAGRALVAPGDEGVAGAASGLAGGKGALDARNRSSLLPKAAYMLVRVMPMALVRSVRLAPS